MQDIKVRVEALIAGLLLINVPLIEGVQFYVSHVFFGFFAVLIALKGFNSITLSKATLLMAVFVLLVVNVSTVLFSEVGQRFYPDTVKMLYFVLCIPIFVEAAKYINLERVLLYYVAAFPLVFACYLVLYTDYFSYSGRFYMEETGSPNVFGVYATMSLLFIIYKGKQFLSRNVRLLLLIFYLSITLLTMSRAAILAMLVAVAVKRYGVGKAVSYGVPIFIVLISISPVASTLAYDLNIQAIDKLNLYKDIFEKGGSYRFELWGTTIQQFLDEPRSWFFGFGPGKIISVQHAMPVYHPHNTYLFMLFSYGLIGFTLFIIMLILLAVNLIKKNRRDSFYYSVLIYYLIIFMFDVHLSSSQFLVFHVLFVSLLVYKATCRKKDKGYFSFVSNSAT